ncbi:TonB-dependent receptor plug domain-containing protein [Terricaulis sp.]|uniref:TonB-dependent receptor plug domain-containing protein n=1 Tax=Terricaulis sp. TaxID=2768686 RepID=UPI002AC3F669|nr:TonB-dependent receptor [Terricaulis sp.]MDZ4690282.1 TonB-dependent receptor [Terricaulis sp.]
MKRARTRLLTEVCLAAGLALMPASAFAEESVLTAPGRSSDSELEDLSLEQLGDVQVTSVSGSAQSVGEAPAAIFVITADDIERAGNRSIPAALRQAPNLQVARLDSANYAITARGFNHSSGTANKLLVMVDGRIVYTPLYSGVFWDEQNAIMEDLDRIEVVSGPGGVLWGSNAVNGVINIVSREAHETQGLLVSGGASETSRALGARYGGRFGDNGAYRVYGLGLRRSVDEPTEWRNYQLGFRSDWGGARDAFTLQGDLYHGDQDQLVGALRNTEISGGNILGRWTRRFSSGAELSVQAYADRSERRVSSGISAEVDAAAVDTQYQFSLGERHNLIIGAGARTTEDAFTPGPGTVFLNPAARRLDTLSAYIQDTVAITDDVDLIAGVKLEENDYTGLEYMPSLRLAWRPDAGSLVWAAVSRAVRTPSRFDTELQNTGVLNGGPTFGSEDLLAYELGYRAQANERLWFSLSTYFNVYDDLRTLEATSLGVFPLEVRNGMSGETYGVEAWGSYAIADWWRLNAGLNWQDKDLQIDPGSADVFGVDFAGNDPNLQLSLRSLMDIGDRIQLDLSGRYVSELPSPQVDAYVAVDARIGLRITDHFELSIAGYNLLDGDGRSEFINPSLPPIEIERSLFISARWRS